MTAPVRQDRDWLARRALPFAIAVTAIFWIGPYWSWPTPAWFRLSVLAVLLSFGGSLVTRARTFALRDILLGLFLVVLVVYYAACSGRGGPFEPSYGYLALLLFMLADDDVKQQSFRDFSWLFALSLVPGLVVFVFALVGIPLPWHSLYPARFDYELLRGNNPGYYRQYLGSIVRSDQVIPLGRGEIFRFHGMWDEPGTVGTYGGLLLLAGGMRLRRQPQNVILLIGGLLSFSLAFYLIVIAYGLTRWPLRVLAVLGAITGILMSSESLILIPAVYNLVVIRFTINKSGNLVANNRVSGLFSALYHDFWHSDLWTRLFGSTTNVSLLVNTGTFSYEVVIFTYGVVGMLLLLAFLVTATTSFSVRRSTLVLLALFLVSIYQRPNVLTMPYLVLLLGGAIYLERQARTRELAAVPA